MPVGKGWQKPENCITDPAKAKKVFSNGYGMGAVLGVSRPQLCSLDIDNVELSRIALASVGVDSGRLLTEEKALPLIGNPDARETAVPAPRRVRPH